MTHTHTNTHIYIYIYIYILKEENFIKTEKLVIQFSFFNDHQLSFFKKVLNFNLNNEILLKFGAISICLGSL